MYGYTYTSYTAHDREVWAARMADVLLTATRFTVHCWHEETEAIAMACRHGEIVPGDWAHGVYISGAVTDAFRAMVLETLSVEAEQLTPFFTIDLDNGVSTAHWGTEFHHCGWTETDLT